MKRFATVVLFTTLLCGCPETKTKEPAPAPAASSEEGDEATDDDDKTPEEMAEDKKDATKKGVDKAHKAFDDIMGGG